MQNNFVPGRHFTMQYTSTKACESTRHCSELYRSACFCAMRYVFRTECPDYRTLICVIWQRSQKRSNLLLFSGRCMILLYIASMHAWIEIISLTRQRWTGTSPPPHGGRRLKCARAATNVELFLSHPARGAWIEINSCIQNSRRQSVAPRAERAD